MKQIRYANVNDIDFWLSLDKHISIENLTKKINDKECLVILDEEKLVGILRYNLFWDNTPFINMLYIKNSYQRNGYGKELVHFFETEMKLLGYSNVMTSTQINEDGKFFWKSVGYKEIGSFILEEDPKELIFNKQL